MHSICTIMPKKFGMLSLSSIRPASTIFKQFTRSTILLALCTQVLSFSSFTTKLMDPSKISYVNADVAKLIDERLMSQPGFSIDQLMELAGYSVASAAHDFYMSSSSNVLAEKSENPKVLIFCGPGNNGGDGLVAARHLKHFGYQPLVYYPKVSSGQLFENLIHQCYNLDIPVNPGSSSIEEMNSVDLIVDSLFGFSFKGPARQPFQGMIENFTRTKTPVLSVDIPSGWDVNEGDIHHTGFIPDAVISLTLPKQCMKSYDKVHYVGGRFMSTSLASELQVTLPEYGFGPNQIVRLDNSLATTSVKKECSSPTTSSEIVAMFVTASSPEEANRIANHLVTNQLVACVNLLPQVTSIYEWEGQLESSQEVLMMLKTRKELTAQVTEAIKSLHSYSVPESIVVHIDSEGSNPDYLNWVLSQTNRNPGKKNP